MPRYAARHASASPRSTARAASIAAELDAQERTSSRAANCSEVLVPGEETATVTPTVWARRACFSLERVLIVPAFDRQVDRHQSRTRRCLNGRGGEKSEIGMRIVFTKSAR